MSHYLRSLWSASTVLDRAAIERHLGAQFVADVLSSSNAIGFCDSRRTGAWDANDSEGYAAYRSLGILARVARGA
jgi:hypothetical protein